MVFVGKRIERKKRAKQFLLVGNRCGVVGQKNAGAQAGIFFKSLSVQLEVDW